jgi:hypothetical protein
MRAALSPRCAPAMRPRATRVGSLRCVARYASSCATKVPWRPPTHRPRVEPVPQAPGGDQRPWSTRPPRSAHTGST